MKNLLEAHEGWTVAGEAANGQEAVELATKLRPDVAILDLSMPELNGLEAASKIQSRLPQAEILIFTMYDTEEVMRGVLSSGAKGCLLKTDMEEHLVAAVEALLQHNWYFSSKASKALKDTLLQNQSEVRPRPAEDLTEREREIVRLLAQAKSNKEVASALNISVRTVETHRAAIMRKLELNSIVQLVHYAIRKRLIQI
jgi:DNA-binding NarL/FixJ family response regulator